MHGWHRNLFENPNADPHPFVPRLYETPRAREAAEATAKAAESQQQAGAAGSISGQYLANTVLFAAVLFFANAAGRFNVKVHQLVIASFARSKGLHKHAGVNRCLLHALNRQHTGSAFQRVELVHQPIALSRPGR